MTARAPAAVGGATATRGAPASARPRRWRAALLAVLALSSGLPFLVLVVQSVAASWRWPSLLPPAFTAEAWRSAFGGGLGTALLTSLLLAALTAVTATAVALPVARALSRTPKRWRVVGAALVFLPVATPPLALGVGLQVSVLRLGLGGTLPGVWLAHLVPATGYLALVLLGAFLVRDARDEETARTLGASRWATWRHVLLPALAAPVGEALAIGFLVSWTQVPLTLLVGGGLVRALPVEVFSLLRAGEERTAAVGALLLVLPAMLAIAALRLSARRTDAPVT